MTVTFDPDAFSNVGKLAAAFVFALPAGFIGEKETPSAGLRTFPLVAMATCGCLLLGQPPGHATADVQSRILQGLVAGIGFIGGGAIVKIDNHVHGVATAAGIFGTGIVGAAIAEDRLSVAYQPIMNASGEKMVGVEALCRWHHREVHHCSDEAAWWERIGINPNATARALWLKSHPLLPAHIVPKVATSVPTTNSQQRDSKCNQPVARRGRICKTKPILSRIFNNL